ncbi:nitronate monooxygenase [Novosphingobium sp. PS1R-30]|uniref:Nitronate monooxygenase n=1 Tax=Novosphingobium anseongense TaxID=3133436 RepID=A0ABU8S1B2_9SPHN
MPLIAAPMFRVSNVPLVAAACRAGVIGAFPTANCRSLDELSRWLGELREQLGPADAPFAANLIMRRETMAQELDLLCEAKVELVITSVGSPAAAIPALHEAGALVFADVASLAHARKALDAGADGLVLLSAGAGGQTGSANGMAFARAVRKFFSGPLVLAGGIADGKGLLAARALDVDFGYMGTRFIATRESAASDAYKAMLVASDLDDVLLTSAFTGLPSNMLIPSIEAAGLSPHELPEEIAAEVSDQMYGSGGSAGARRWSEVWSAGHSVSGVNAIPAVQTLIEDIAAEFRAAGRAMAEAMTHD